MTVTDALPPPQGSELAGWALGRWSYEGIDMNHNFADLNSVMWTAIELETDRSKLINHYFPIPEQYTSEEAFVSKHSKIRRSSCTAFDAQFDFFLKLKTS